MQSEWSAKEYYSAGVALCNNKDYQKAVELLKIALRAFKTQEPIPYLAIMNCFSTLATCYRESAQQKIDGYQSSTFSSIVTPSFSLDSSVSSLLMAAKILAVQGIKYCAEAEKVCKNIPDKERNQEEGKLVTKIKRCLKVYCSLIPAEARGGVLMGLGEQYRGEGVEKLAACCFELANEYQPNQQSSNTNTPGV